MLSFDFTVKISDILYEWLLEARGTDSGESFKQLFSNATPMTGHGIEICFFLLLAFSLIAALAFYFGIASKITAATKKNYITTYICGYILLVIANFLVLQLAIPEADVFSGDNLANLLKISLIDVVYYTVLFEVWSLCMKGFSKAPNIDLISIFKK